VALLLCFGLESVTLTTLVAKRIHRDQLRDKLLVLFIRTIPKSTEAVQALGMRAGIVVNVTRAGRHRLEAIVSDRSAPQKHVWRANII
jgi:hypothetical protein